MANAKFFTLFFDELAMIREKYQRDELALPRKRVNKHVLNRRHHPWPAE